MPEPIGSNAEGGYDRQLVGRYLIKEQLAAGGMGVVYRAVDSATGQECALKRIKLEVAGNEHGIESFEREYRVLAGIDHPRIIRVYDYGVDEAGPYYTMELVEGTDLRKLAPVSFTDACRYLRDVATSLALLHARRLLHRDLSPRNVRVTPDGHCKLLDFGALAAFGPSNVVVGTPPAIPPEAARGGSLDQRSDLYALGALGYWLVTGRHAYPAKRIDELPELWRTAPEPPSALADDVDKRLDDLLLSLLQLDPLARPASAAEVIARLNSLAALEPEDDLETTRLARSFLATPHFVGRKAALGTLEGRVRDAISGSGGAVLIEGASGTGRTRLLEELGVIGKLVGAQVLRVDASVHRQLHGTARALVRQLLDVAPSAADTTARLSPAAMAQVGDVSSRMRLRHSMPVPSGTAEPSLVSGVSLESWLAEVSAALPLLIEVDNVEYADDSSLGMLAALARGARGQRVLLVVTKKPSKPREGSVGLNALRPHCERVDLAPLDAGETQELARSLFGDAAHLQRFSEFLYARTAGNPMHCMEVARQLIAARAIRYLDGNWALPAERPDVPLPSALEGALSARIAALSEPARQLAECLALHRGEATARLLRKLMGGDGDRRMIALQDELARHDVVHGGEEGFRFASTALQETLLAELDDDARQRAHKRLGDALLQLAGADEQGHRVQAGWHLLRGGEESRGAELIAAVASDSVAVRLLFTSLHGAGSALEAALHVYRRQRRSRFERLPLLSALAQAGYYEDRRFGELYGDEALDTLEDVSGLRAARVIARFGGRFLGLVFGLGFGLMRFALSPRKERKYGFAEVLLQLFSSATCLTGVAALSLDAERAQLVTDVLRPFDVLPERLTPCGILEFCDGLRMIALERQAEAMEKFERLLSRLNDSSYYPTLRGDARKIIVAGVHFARGVFGTYSASGKAALESADALDALDFKFYAMIASELRFLYFMNRGDFRTAAQHRQQVDIHAAHVGSAWQAELWESAALIPVYTWLLDVDGMARVTDRLEQLGRTVPSLRPYARLARWAQGLVLTDATRGANATALEMLEQTPPRSYIGWAMHLGSTATGSRILGNYAVARRLCETVLLHMTPADQEYVGLFLIAEIERAWCDASEGRPDAALAQLDGLLARYRDCDHPLVHGLLHEARALVAHGASRDAVFAESAAEVERWLRPIGNPALIARCERLAGLRGRGRLGSGRRANADVTRWLEMLSGYEDREERIAHGLELLRRAADAPDAAFYGIREGAFVRMLETPGAQFPELGPPELLEAAQRVANEPSTQATGTAATVLRTAPVQLADDGRGQQLSRQAYLLVDSQGERRVVGAVALHAGRGSKAPPPALLRALTEALDWDDATVAEPTRSVLPKRARANS